ncbi:M28 family peptidase [Enorma phocaeensis]|uniref:M28 family peptidase n=1 Tax=Enorma phocaeensis TaxID=1871019 RepID=A0A921IV28_9ACTN|nr:M28 family peptidase [Enorma phocaeensis]HJG37390.1 M28 family peptidase [Enorma phocaeensis]
MATTRKYLAHLLQNTGITPACSEEEHAAAEDLAAIFSAHGFEPEIQEFKASGSRRMVLAILGIVTFIGSVLMGIGGPVGVIGLLLVVVAAALFILERFGKISFASIGAGGLSQNVIAYHKASGPLASPRNRPVVVVAHYDSPRADLLSQFPYVNYRPMLVKFMPAAMIAPAAIAIARLLPLPGAAKLVLWLLAIVAALVPLANAVATIMNRMVLPYTSGAVCNKSSVAAMLGVMDAVAPCQREVEFPNDIPFDEYFAEQRRLAEEAELAAAVAAGDLPEDAMDKASEDDAEGEDAAVDEGALDADATMAGTASIPVDAFAGATAAMEVLDGGDAAANGDAEQVDVPHDPDATQAMPPLTEDEGESDSAAADSVDAGVEPVEEESAERVEQSSDAVMTEAAPTQDPEPEVEPEAEPVPSIVNKAGNYRYGLAAIQAIGMVPESCVIEYEAPVEDEIADAVPVEPAEKEPEAEGSDERQVDEELESGSDEYYSDEYEDSGSYDEEYDDYAYEEDEGGYEIQHASRAGGIAEAISAAGAGAARLFDGVFKRGKSLVEQAKERASALEASHAADGDEEAAAMAEDEAVGNDEASQQVAASEELSELDATVEVPASPFASEVPSSEIGEPPSADDGASPAEQGEIDEDVAAQVADPDATQRWTPSYMPQQVSSAVVDLGATVAQEPLQMVNTVQESAPVQEPETVDSLMAQISRPRTQAVNVNPLVSVNPLQASSQRFSAVPDPSLPSVNQGTPINRASLFDLPDPSSAPIDPFAPIQSSAPAAPATQVPEVPAAPSSAPASPSSGFSVISAPNPEPVAPVVPAAGDGAFETIRADAPAPMAPRPAAPKRSRGGLFHRKKREQESMSDWLGVDENFDAKSSGRDIGSWDNFEGDDWKGGATGAEGVTEEDLRDAITSMGDDELLGHDIWFVATGASELDHAGIAAFLNTHRDRLRGVFLINLESVGAGELCTVATEGDVRVLKGDKRITNLVHKVSSAFHHKFGSVEMPFVSTDAYAAMDMSLRALTIAGVDGSGFACSHTVDDVPHNIDAKNVDRVADVVTEVIRRS